MITYNKLVRDRIPEIIEKEGKTLKSRILDNDEFKAELLKKMVKEANEVLATKGEPKELVKEISDVLEVIDGLIDACGLDRAKIENVKTARREARGGFSQKIFLIEAEG